MIVVVVLCNMMSSGIFFHTAMICYFFLPAVTYLLFVFFSVGLACSVFNLFSYGFGVCGIWYLFPPFFCHWVINETLFRSVFVLASLNPASVSACISFVLFLKSGSRDCIFFLTFVSAYFTSHLLSTSLHFFFTFKAR